jgi:hypothetical protein
LLKRHDPPNPWTVPRMLDLVDWRMMRSNGTLLSLHLEYMVTRLK